MTTEAWLNALLYEAALWLIRQRPSLASAPWLKLLLAHCRPFWEAWKVANTMQKVDQQTIALVKLWEEEEREIKANELAAKAHKLFPQATITPLPNAPVPSVMIVHEAPADASDSIKALGGELRITWQPPD